MAGWRDYWREQMDGIEEVEEHSERSWAAALALLLLLETRLRNRVARRIAGLPTDEQGRIDARGRRAMIAFRAGVQRDVKELIRTGSMQLSGVRGAGVAVAPTTGLQVDAVREAARIAEEAFDAAQAAATARELAATGSKEESIEQFARRVTRRERDIEDILLDAAENPSRQLLYDGWRFFETVKGVGTRFGTKDAVLDYVQGSEG